MFRQRKDTELFTEFHGVKLGLRLITDHFFRFDFERDDELLALLRATCPVSWSATKGCWYTDAEGFELNKIFNAFRGKAWVDYNGLKTGANKKEDSPIKTQPKKKPTAALPAGYTEMLEQKRYSLNTQKIYISYMRDFATMFYKYDLERVSKDQINRYILWLIREKGISASQQNQRINAIKFYYEKVLGREKEYYDIERPGKALYCRKYCRKMKF